MTHRVTPPSVTSVIFPDDFDSSMRRNGTVGRQAARAKDLVEWSLALNLRLLARPISGGDEGLLRLRARMCVWEVEAHYRVKNDGQLKLAVSLPMTHAAGSVIELTSVRLVSGGERPYFLCPGLPASPGCGRRVEMLYLPLFGLHAFACRRCHGLAYRSSRVRPLDLEVIRSRIRRALPLAGKKRSASALTGSAGLGASSRLAVTSKHAAGCRPPGRAAHC